MISVVGTPSLRQIRFISLGLKNHGHDIYEQDGVEVWFDELRVSDVKRDPGWAATGAMDLDIAGKMLSLHADVRQTHADFHGIDKRIGSNQNLLSGRGSASFKLDALLNPQWYMSLPISANFRQQVNVPRYQSDSDVLLTSLTDKPIDIWDIFIDNLKHNKRYTEDTLYQEPVDKEISLKKDLSYSFSAAKTRYSDNIFTKYTIERIRLRNLSHTRQYSTNANYMYDNDRDVHGDLEYNLSFDKPWEINWFAWSEGLPLLGRISESRLRPLPSSFSTGLNAEESISETRRWTRDEPEPERYTLSTERRFSIGFRPVTPLSFDFGQTVRSNRVREDSLRRNIAIELSELEIESFRVTTPDTSYIDPEYYELLEADVKRIKDLLFWNGFGAWFIDHNFTQNFSISFSPSFVSWLSTSASYNPTYKWIWGQNYGPLNRQVNVNSRLSTNITLRLPQIMSRLAGPESGIKGRKDSGMPSPWDDDWDESDLDKDWDKRRDKEEEKDSSGRPGGRFDIGKDDSPSSLWTGGVDSTGGDTLPGSVGQTFPSVEEGVPETDKKGDSDGGDVEPDTTRKEEVKPMRPPPTPWLLVQAVLTRLRDIGWDYNQTNSITNPAVGFGQAGWKYRLGFTRDPGMEKVPGAVYTDIYSRSDQHTFSSGFDITQNLSVSRFSYEYGWTRNIGQGESGSYNRTVWQLFESDDITIKHIPVVNWSTRWSGWEQLPLLNVITQSVSLENSFNGRMRENWSQTVNDSEKVTQSVEYEKNFSPILGINFSWKGGVSTNIGYNVTQSVRDERIGNRKTKDNSNEISLRGSYTSRTGFRIPIPVWPFKNRRFSNSTTFSLSYNNRRSKSESSADDAKFELDREEKSWSIEPSIDYRFSDAVTGNFHYEYAVQKSLLTGTTKTHNFGFSVNISIRG